MFRTKNTIEEFSPDIYPYTFWVSTDNNLKLINERFTQYYNDTDQGPLQESSPTDILYVCQVLEKKTNKVGSLLVMVRKKITYGDIAHEAVHMANRLYSHIGKRIDTENDEDYAYLVGWIVNKISERNGKCIFSL